MREKLKVILAELRSRFEEIYGGKRSHAEGLSLIQNGTIRFS
jgi:hypothetical protein